MARRVIGHASRCPATCTELRARAAPSSSTRTGCRRERHLDGELRLHHPARRGRRPGAAPCRPIVYGHGLLGRRRRGRHPGSSRSSPDVHGFVALRDRRDRHGGERHPERDRDPQRPLGFPKLADRLQQGLLNELYLGRLMIHPSGFASATRRSTSTRTASHAACDRHEPPLLQRQQPGRDHGRCADRDRARLHPRGARAWRR